MATVLAQCFLATFQGNHADPYLHQYSRVVMVKAFLVAAILAGIRGPYEDITCHEAANTYSDVVPQVRRDYVQ